MSHKIEEAVQTTAAAPASGTKVVEGVKPSIPDPSRIMEGRSKSITMMDLGSDVPDKSWDDDELVAYAKDQVAEIQALSRKVAVHVYRLGMTLAIYRSRHLEHGEWEAFLKKVGLSTATAWRAVQLAERAESEEAVAELGITQAYLKYEILRKAAKEKDAKPSPGGEETAGKPAPEATGEGVPKASDQKKVSGEVAPETGEARPQEEEPSSEGQEPEDEGDGADDLVIAKADAKPAKEQKTPLSVLVAITRGLTWVEENVKSDDWDQSQTAACRQRLQDIIEVAQRIDAALA